MTMKGDEDVDGKSEKKKVSKVFILLYTGKYRCLCKSHVTRDKYLDGYPEIKKLILKSGFPSRRKMSSRFGNCSKGRRVPRHY